MTLPFDLSALEPHISKETLEYHHGKHHAGYVSKLNSLIKDTAFEKLGIEDVIKNSDGAVFNNAAQVYNHDFYFKGMSNKRGELSQELTALINRDFISLGALRNAFMQVALGLFGSGWVWLCVNKSGKLVIEAHSNASNPLLAEHTPLLTCDVWEHAYYIDYRNARAAYLEQWWNLINWDFVSDNLHTCKILNESVAYIDS